MHSSEELFDLRAERLMIIKQLEECSNVRRQDLNKKLTDVTRKIQKLVGITPTAGSHPESRF